MEGYQFDMGDSKTKQSNKKTILIVVLCCVFCFALILAFTICLARNEKQNDYLTYENYCSIQDGMTYMEVVDIFDGNEGVLDTSSSYGGYTLTYYTWSRGGKVVVVGFENNKVCSKSQIGL